MIGKIHRSIPECGAEPAQLVGDCFMAQTRHRLGHEFINHHFGAIAGLADDLLRKLDRQDPSYRT